MGKIDSILKTLGIKESEEDELLLESDVEINEGPVEPKMKPAEPVTKMRLPVSISPTFFISTCISARGSRSSTLICRR